ncbi:YdhK family protein [Fructilactobacillus florum]|nr:YdhK family protein [Fructilactobacillus florum]
MKMKKIMMASLTTVTLAVSAANTVSPVLADSNNSSNMNMNNNKMDKKSMDMSKNKGSMAMMMKHDNALPTDLKMAKNPKFKVNSMVKIKANHMPGMKGAMAKVTGAYDTNLYEINYKPTNGGKEVKNHKYVVKSELTADNNKGLKKGSKVTVKADHMDGMKGAKGKVVKCISGPAYAVTFTPTTGGQEYVNHLWLSQKELEKA